MLDARAVQAFVLVADLASFTRAAAALNSSQAAVSLQVSRLEKALGRRLLDRSPRLVRLSPDGASFLPAARELVVAQHKALGSFTVEQRRVVVSISHHIVGGDLPKLLQHLHRSEPGLVVEVRIATSREAIAALAAGSCDCAIVLNHDGKRSGGELLFKEEFRWMATPEFEHRPGSTLRLATQAAPCSVRAMAIDALDKAGIRWSEAFVGGGVETIGAAASAGLAVAALARRVAPPGTVDVGRRLSLPQLPSREVLLLSAPSNADTRRAIKALSGAFRALAGR
jgi:DNA-binding transcriptional LysR family regulator